MVILGRYAFLKLTTDFVLTHPQVANIRASSNNRASTVLDVFREAVERYGVPSRIRVDRGGENIDTATLMILVRGPNRASAMWGASTNNTKVERIWPEVGSQFARQWKGFFLRLERLHGLNRNNPHHLWLLHTLFLSSINDDCKKFAEVWNSHPISGHGHNQSPNVLVSSFGILFSF